MRRAMRYFFGTWYRPALFWAFALTVFIALAWTSNVPAVFCAFLLYASSLFFLLVSSFFLFRIHRSGEAFLLLFLLLANILGYFLLGLTVMTSLGGDTI